jgi:MFS family permease
MADRIPVGPVRTPAADADLVPDRLRAGGYALGVGQTNDYITSKDFVAASAGLLFAWAVGSTVGPTAAAFIMSLAGGKGLFLYNAIVLGLIAGFIVYRMLARKALPPKLQTNFRPIQPSPKGGAHELDPRIEEEHPMEVTGPAPATAGN